MTKKATTKKATAKKAKKIDEAKFVRDALVKLVTETIVPEAERLGMCPGCVTRAFMLESADIATKLYGSLLSVVSGKAR